MTTPLSDSENAVEIRGLRKHFPGFDLGPLDLTIPQGSVYGFVGPNGAGKTTSHPWRAGTLRLPGKGRRLA